MIALSLAVLVSLYSGLTWPGPVAIAAFAVFVLASHSLCGRRERFLLALSAALTVAVFTWAPDAAQLVLTALDRAVFLAAFMILLALLREGAITSPAILQVGSYLTRQPPSRRYLSIHLGGHLLAILLNFGALNLLGPLITRGIDASSQDSRVASIRKERQISALLRGFSSMVFWSPTAITQALVFAVVPGIDPARMLGLGLLLVALTTGAGWSLDWVTGRRAQRLIPATARPQFRGADPFPVPAFWHFAAVCAGLAASTILVVLLAGVTIVPALMLVAPVVTALWIVKQNLGRNGWAKPTLARFTQVAAHSMPRGSPEAVTLACAGYCGICAASLIDPHWFAESVGLTHWPDLAIYAAAILLPALLANVGLPPLMVITFLGTLLSGLPGVDFEPTLLALAFCVGWALNLTGSPFGISAIILARITDIPARVLTWRWNGWFSLATFVLSASVLMAFAGR